VVCGKNRQASLNSALRRDKHDRNIEPERLRRAVKWREAIEVFERRR
jgi:hypothetical protein